MKGVEFYNSPNGDIIMQQDGENVTFSVEDVDVIQNILDIVQMDYADAYQALRHCYAKSAKNEQYYKYKMVSRFIRCNCGAYDTLRLDLDDLGRLNIEQVSCPLRGSGDCPYDNIICMPRQIGLLAPRQLEVARLLADGRTNWNIAETMGISIATVHNVITIIKGKLNIKNTGQIVTWYNEHYR